MRTTVALDDDLPSGWSGSAMNKVAASSVIDEAIRAGLEALQQIPQQRTPDEPESYTEPIDLGLIRCSHPSRVVARPGAALG
jgi:hypothetical protein